MTVALPQPASSCPWWLEPEAESWSLSLSCMLGPRGGSPGPRWLGGRLRGAGLGGRRAWI